MICISANLSSQTLTDKMNVVKPRHDGRFCVHMPKSVRNSPTCPSTPPQEAILLLTRSCWWEGEVELFFSQFPQNRPHVSCPSWQQQGVFVVTHCQKATRKVAICPGMWNPNFKCKRDMNPLNLDQIPLSLARSVTHCGGCGLITRCSSTAI